MHLFQPLNETFNVVVVQFHIALRIGREEDANEVLQDLSPLTGADATQDILGCNELVFEFVHRLTLHGLERLEGLFHGLEAGAGGGESKALARTGKCVCVCVRKKREASRRAKERAKKQKEYKQRHSLEDTLFHAIDTRRETPAFRRQLIHFTRQAFVRLRQRFHLRELVLLQGGRRSNEDPQDATEKDNGVEGRLKDERQQGEDDCGGCG